MNKPLPPFFIITGSCVRSQTFTPRYTSSETWVRYSDFVDYFPVALDECAEDKVALTEENARLKADVERSTAQYNGIIDTQLKAIDELKAEVERLNAVIESHKDAGKRLLAMLDEERRKNAAKEGKQS